MKLQIKTQLAKIVSALIYKYLFNCGIVLFMSPAKSSTFLFFKKQ